MTGTLVYSRVFWDLDCVGLREPQRHRQTRNEVASAPNRPPP
jgi:hypothetical protein